MTSRPRKMRILAVSTVDVMPWVLLRPWLEALQRHGYEVHIACSRGAHFDQLAAQGFQMHDVALRRSFNPAVHLRPLVQLYRLLRRTRFDVMNMHSPVAAAVGRVAGWLAGTKPLLYTVHGFYFHDRMPAAARWLFQALEWLLGRITDDFMFVSEEDRQKAVRLGIARSERQTTTILNGADLSKFSPRPASGAGSRAARKGLGGDPPRPVVGIVGRIVREKGYREFLCMASTIASRGREAGFLVVGDTLPSDRDQFGASFREKVRAAGLADRFVFTGFTSEVAERLRSMDVFVLPSYREGFPRSVVEAMATGLPVVATDIRGCREAVVHGVTGLIVPPKDAEALTDAVLYLLDHPDEARRMGAAGRVRAEQLFDQRMVEERFVGVFDAVLGRKAIREEVTVSGA